MTPPDLQLPDDVETLKAMVLAMAEKAARADALESEVADLKARNADADERIERLTQILKAFDRARFGRRSESWLTQTLERIANGWPSSDVDALMPWNYAG
ncbi:transposase domain-containing protein [Agrobacterium sp. S2/73]|nr:transposase domain-containing protein [Agrobacterium sp. S2/73]QXZ76031.1 transposase domain-containing protein [Agrobacterium sp. S7/73]QYA16958.1 transposase domain-containing protein [Rhizobium sp. AB2/73]UEQ85469.1 transposase domain-containing protein [Rhizobium sp. AB2/73]